MKESKYGRRGSAVPVHDLRIQQLEAEVERLTKPDCGWVLQGDYAETGCGQEVALINEDMSWVEYCPYCGGPVLEESM